MRRTVMAVGAVAAMSLLGACGGAQSPAGEEPASGEESAATGEDVHMTFWHNSTTGEGKEYWENVVAAFEDENPGVTIEIEAIQNEDMDGKLQNALQAGDAPDIFMARGGGKLVDVVEAGKVMDLSDKVSEETKAAVNEAAFAAFEVHDGLYGMPVAVLPGGLFYSEDLFDDAGITETPKTVEELEAAVDKLRESGVEPIALGAKDAWPAAHWYYFFALRECPREAIEEDGEARALNHECWTKAAERLDDFVQVDPFNEGYLTTPAQQGAGSSAGLIANHKAGMELMGAWNPGVIKDLTPDQEAMPDLQWFPFPEIDGGEGAPGAMMGGVDGYSCYVDAPDACPEFLNFFMQKEYQEEYARAYSTLPASVEAQGVVEEPSLKDILDAYNEAPYIVVWLDTMLGQNVGNAVNSAVVEMLAGNLSPDAVAQAVNDAAAKG